MKRIMNFLKDEDGVTAIEYALIAALVAVAGIVGWNALGDSVNSQATSISTIINNPEAAAS